VIAKFLRKKVRPLKRALRNRGSAIFVAVAVLCISVIAYTSYMENRRLSVDPATYRPLLDLVASVESKGNYNAHFGNATNSNIDFTNMTIHEVLKWQSNFVSQGNFSSAVGRYQIVNTTLSGLVRQLGLSVDQKFNSDTQDALAIALIERRGAEQYVNEEITKEQFAANLAMEWAALPKNSGDNPNDSYYASDGVNKALVDSAEVIRAIEKIQPN
jgi:muramidase (phage lysozyme)